MRLYPHPVISPEYFQLLPHSSVSKIKALLVPHDRYISPQIVTDQFDIMLTTFYPKEDYTSVTFTNDVTMYFEILSQSIHKTRNFIATYYFRHQYMMMYGKPTSDVINGNVLFVHAKNIHDDIYDTFPHSVSYNLVEEILEIHEIQCNT